MCTSQRTLGFTKLLTAESAEKSQRSQRTNFNKVWLFGPWVARFWFRRVVWRGGKDESALETWFADNEKRDVASYVSTKANLKILEN
jgi:hypothetical protein